MAEAESVFGHGIDPVGVRRLLLPALRDTGLIAAPTLEAFRDAGFGFDHAIRQQLPMTEVRRQRDRAARYRSEWAARATHLVTRFDEFQSVWVMGRIARNAVAALRPALKAARNLETPYVLDVEPRFFFSAYFRPRFDNAETIRNVVTAFKRFLTRATQMAELADGDVARVLAERRQEILAIARRRGANNVRVFGSVARGEADESSDIDFLVDLEPGRSLLDMGGLVMDRRGLLGREVDVVTERGLKLRIRDRVLREAIIL